MYKRISHQSMACWNFPIFYWTFHQRRQHCLLLCCWLSSYHIQTHKRCMQTENWEIDGWLRRKHFTCCHVYCCIAIANRKEIQINVFHRICLRLFSNIVYCSAYYYPSQETYNLRLSCLYISQKTCIYKYKVCGR